jgi:hypothetical protein
LSSRVIQSYIIGGVISIMGLRSLGWFILIIRSKVRTGKVGQEISITVFGVFKESLMDTADEPTLTTCLEMRPCASKGSGRPWVSGGKPLRRAGFGSIRAVTNLRVIMILGGMGFPTDPTSLGVKPVLPGRVGSLGCRATRCHRRRRGGDCLECTVREGGT